MINLEEIVDDLEEGVYMCLIHSSIRSVLDYAFGLNIT
jgi:hypothetical protein